MITLNSFTVLSIKFTIPWRGVWIADVKLDIQDPALLPSGLVVIIMNDLSVLTGTVDPLGSGTFSSTAYLRVRGGGGGWDKPVPAQHFVQPGGGLLSPLVYNATATVVGERVVDASPIVFGTNFIRSAGAASRIFEDRDYHVDPITGVTLVGPWLPTTLDSGSTIANFSPIEQKGQVYSDSLVLPGTILTDDRFNGKTYTVRDVEHTFDEHGNHATVWCCENPVSRLQEALACAVREFAGTAYMKTYLYRFVLGSDTSLALQAITAGAPNLNPIDQWTGMSGVISKLAPSTELIVGFVGGDPTQPYIIGYSTMATPLQVNIAGGANFLTPAPWSIKLLAALVTFSGSVGTATTIGQVAAAGTALGTALLTLGLPSTLLTKAT